MSDRPPYDESEDPETGMPVSELQDLWIEPPPEFVGRVRRAIERRFLVRDVVTFGWRALAAWAFEFMTMLAALVGRAARPGAEEGRR